MSYDDVMQIRKEGCSCIRPQKNTASRNGRRFPWFMAFSSQFTWAHLNYQIGQNNNLEQHKEPEGAPGQGLDIIQNKIEIAKLKFKIQCKM